MKKLLQLIGPQATIIRNLVIAGTLILLSFFGILIIWSVTAPLETAAVVKGEVILKANRKTIEHLEGGIVKAIYVHEGDFVKKGGALIQLDKTQAESQYFSARKEVDALLAKFALLIAEKNQTHEILFPMRLLQSSDADTQKQIQFQRAQFKTDQESLNKQLEIYQQEITQLLKEIESVEAQVKANDAQMALINKETEAISSLVNKHLVEKPRLWALQRETARLSGNKGEQLGQIAKAQQKISQIQQQKIMLKENFQKLVLQNLSDTQIKLGLALEKEKALSDILKRTQIKAPQDGTVVGLQVHTIGGVILPGKPLLDLVPAQADLIVEVKVNPIDVEAMHPGLPAKVQLLAYKPRRVPPVEGTVTYISADNFRDDKTGEAYFTARIRIPAHNLQVANNIKLYPGMPVQVMIITQKRTALAYLLSPLLDSFNRAFHEK